jgi:hypothetical protein
MVLSAVSQIYSVAEIIIDYICCQLYVCVCSTAESSLPLVVITYKRRKSISLQKINKIHASFHASLNCPHADYGRALQERVREECCFSVRLLKRLKQPPDDDDDDDDDRDADDQVAAKPKNRELRPELPRGRLRVPCVAYTWSSGCGCFAMITALVETIFIASSLPTEQVRDGTKLLLYDRRFNGLTHGRKLT